MIAQVLSKNRVEILLLLNFFSCFDDDFEYDNIHLDPQKRTFNGVVGVYEKLYGSK